MEADSPRRSVLRVRPSVSIALPYAAMNRAIFLALLLLAPLARAAEFNVADYGANPDGKTVCTAAIQKAVDAAAAAGAAP